MTVGELREQLAKLAPDLPVLHWCPSGKERKTMIKHYCDWCKVEVEARDLQRWGLALRYADQLQGLGTADVCQTCRNATSLGYGASKQTLTLVAQHLLDSLKPKVTKESPGT